MTDAAKVTVGDLSRAAELLNNKTMEFMELTSGSIEEMIDIGPPPMDFMAETYKWSGFDGSHDELNEWIERVLLRGGMDAEKVMQGQIDAGKVPGAAQHLLRKVMLLNCYHTGLQIGILATRLAQERENDG